MTINVFNKHKSERIDLFLDPNICDPVKQIYEKFRGRCEQYLEINNADKIVRKYYVYTWHTNTSPKMYFYVGKGSGRRYNHILSDIKKYKNGNHNLRFQRYCETHDKWGISYDIIIDKLTEYEALIYEQCLKLQMLDNGEVLLNIEGIPDEYLPEGWYVNQQGTSPTLLKDPVFQRYFEDYGIPAFDKIDLNNLMRTYIYPYFVDTSCNDVIIAKETIINWLLKNDAKIYKALSTNTASIIVFGNLSYDRYVDYKKDGKKIFSSKDVLEYIKMIKIENNTKN